MNDMHLRWLGVLIVSGIAAYHDSKAGHIPNRLIALGLVLGAGGPIAAIALVDRFEALTGAGSAGLGFVVCGAVPLLLFRLAALGGGDVKLLATVGAQLGPTLGLELSFAAFVVAALYWPLRFARAGAVQQLLRAGSWRASNGAGSEARSASAPLSFAFAPCLFVAAVVLTASHWSK